MNFFESYYRAGQMLSDEDELALYRKIFAYMFDGDTTEPDGTVGAMWLIIKPSLEKTKSLAERGRAGGKISKKKANDKPTVSQTQANDKPNVSQSELAYKNAITEKEKEKEKDKDKKEKQEKEKIADVVTYLNQKTDSNYRANTEATASPIRARLHEGFTVDDCKKVIDNMVAEWGGDERMNQYLRPQTLFSTKFESYLNRKVTNANLQKPTKGWGKNYDPLADFIGGS